MHVWEGVWVMSGELEWLLACDEYEMIGYENGTMMREIYITVYKYGFWGTGMGLVWNTKGIGYKGWYFIYMLYEKC